MDHVDLVGSYDPTAWRPAVEVEDRGELVLFGGGLGEHAPGLGPPAGGGVDQHALFDPGQGGQQFADAEVQAGLARDAAHQVGELEGEHAGEQVHADVVVGPVVHRGERHHAPVFELPEGELGVGLGAVAGHDLGDRPVIADATTGGSRLDPASGVVSPRIIGIALDGTRSAVIPVPPGGSPWHDDPVWDHATGLMQFITGTWAVWGVDASGDGLASPHNAYDAIAVAGRYPCGGKRRLAGADALAAAIRRSRYVQAVLADAARAGTPGNPPTPIVAILIPDFRRMWAHGSVGLGA